MGAMEGLNLEQIKERLNLLFWPSLKACWMLWPAVMVSLVLFVELKLNANLYPHLALCKLSFRLLSLNTYLCLITAIETTKHVGLLLDYFLESKP